MQKWLWIVLIGLVKQASSAQNKLATVDVYSPMAKLWMASEQDLHLFPLKLDNKYNCVFWLADSAEIERNWQAIGFGNIYSAWLNKQQIDELMAKSSLVYLDIGGRLNSPRMHVDTSKIMSKVNLVHAGNGTLARTGKNTIVGIVDVGFDGRHPTFLNQNGTQLRVKNWWHQNEKTGSVPAIYNYGSVFTTATDIIAAKDWDGSHGTHVAGIAAGSGFTSSGLKYGGMAPDAEMAWVTIKYTNDTLNGSALSDNIVANGTILDAYKYIFEYAKLAGKPAVINLSWGMHTGPHDGTSLFDKACEQLVGEGKILVGSSGNDGGNNMHVQVDFDVHDTMYTWAIDRSRGSYPQEEIYCDVWGAQNGKFGVNISLFDTLGNKVLSSPFFYTNESGFYKQWFTAGSDSVQITCIPNAKYAGNNKPEMLIFCKTNNAGRLRMRMGFTGDGPIHAWNSGQPYRYTSGQFTDTVLNNKKDKTGRVVKGTRQFSMSENGGTGKAMISVGSYVARNDWRDWQNNYRGQLWLNPGEISNFSSNGPTADMRVKPDIAAPGQLVVSAYNKDELAAWQDEYVLAKTQHNGQDHAWMLASGTSMSSPHVCGIVSLMLEASPQLSSDQVRKILQKTAYKDNFTGAEDSNYARGWGKVNALEAVKEATKIGNVRAINPRDIVLFPNPVQSVLYFGGLPNAKIRCYDISGKLVSTAELDAEQKWDVSHLQNGLYFLQVQLENIQLNTKIIKE